jgi:hypothetical protein
MLVKKFAFDVELLAVAKHLGFTRIYEAPVEVAWTNENTSFSPLILFDKNIKKSKSLLLKQDISMVNNVFSIIMPSQEDLNHSINEVLKIGIRYPDAVAKEEAVKNLEKVLLYQNELNHYLQFYFTILEVGLEKKFKDWIKKFKKSDIYLLHLNNVTQIERAVRWGQTLLASIT